MVIDDSGRFKKIFFKIFQRYNISYLNNTISLYKIYRINYLSGKSQLQFNTFSSFGSNINYFKFHNYITLIEKIGSSFRFLKDNHNVDNYLYFKSKKNNKASSNTLSKRTNFDIFKRKGISKSKNNNEKHLISKINQYLGFNFVNINIVYKIINNTLFFHKLNGFSINAFDVVMNYLHNKIKNFVLILHRSSNIRSNSQKTIRKHWGFNKFNEKKNKNIYKNNVAFLKKAFTKSILNFKKRNLSSKKKIYILKEKSKYLAENSNPNNETSSLNMSTNKTLTTLLTTILKNRINSLKEATKCISSYIPNNQILKNTKKEKNIVINDKFFVKNIKLKTSLQFFSFEDLIFMGKTNLVTYFIENSRKFIFIKSIDCNHRIFKQK
ncbi:hypothetical protein (nucleomorph) [Guillardia theta]|uniref:Uncharacterized protein n=1 Tax=Guillardia theta TaxID=55529 RepID=Q98SD5_GUITH|nr:hypothetical protein GTHECHR3005 [Guillardia theta]AAK39649.1 hypothetical protein [Guillardia theta]